MVQRALVRLDRFCRNPLLSVIISSTADDNLLIVGVEPSERRPGLRAHRSAELLLVHVLRNQVQAEVRLEAPRGGVPRALEEVPLPGTGVQPEFLGRQHVQPAPQVFPRLQDLPALGTGCEIPAEEEVLGMWVLRCASPVEGTARRARREAFRVGKDEGGLDAFEGYLRPSTSTSHSRSLEGYPQ